MDGLWIHPQTPQEDEFALLTLGVESLYRAFWMPHRLPELAALLQQDHWLEDRSWVPPWLEFLRAVQSTDPGGSGPMLLKSPNHTFRLRAIHQTMPGARFIWMAREPRALAESNVKMWSQMFALHGLTPVNLDDLLAFLDQVWTHSSMALEYLLEHVARDQWLVVSQHQLLQEPVQVVTDVCRHFGLAASAGFSAAREDAPVRGPKATSDSPESIAWEQLDTPALRHLAQGQDAALPTAQPYPLSP
jgi:hypothetical protein